MTWEGVWGIWWDVIGADCGIGIDDGGEGVDILRKFGVGIGEGAEDR